MNKRICVNTFALDLMKFYFNCHFITDSIGTNIDHHHMLNIKKTLDELKENVKFNKILIILSLIICGVNFLVFLLKYF